MVDAVSPVEHKQGPLICIVDDDTAVRQTLVHGLDRLGFNCRPAASGEDFLASLEYLTPACILLDLRMPKMDGMAVLKRLGDMPRQFPVIFFTSHGDIETAVLALKLGANDFIEKPSPLSAIAEKITEAIEGYDNHAREIQTRDNARKLLERLTPKELQIATRIAAGCSSKDIAQNLGNSYRTIETHRYNLMKNLRIQKTAQLIKIFFEAKLEDVGEVDQA